MTLMDDSNNNFGSSNYDKKELVFSQITYNNVIYYRDNYNGLWDKSANLVGAIIRYNNKETVELFNRRKIDTTSRINQIV